jgi:hypothetical protein
MLTKMHREITHCLTLLERLGSRWTSARRCHEALRRLLKYLSSITHGSSAQSRMSFPDQQAHGQNGLQAEPVVPYAPARGENEPKRTKRRRTVGGDGTSSQVTELPQPRDHSAAPGEDGFTESLLPMPILEYHGPDFGFDSAQMNRQDISQDLFGDFANPYAGGFFTDAGWDAFIQGLDPEGYFNA